MTVDTQDDVQRLRDQVAQLSAELERLKEERQQEVAELNELMRISTQLNSTLKLSELLRLIMSSARDLSRAEACSVALRDDESGELVFEVAVGEKSDDLPRKRVPAGQGIAGRVVETGRTMVVNSIEENPYFYDQIDRATGFATRNMLAVPLVVRDRTIGVVEIINSQGRDLFDEHDVRLAEALTSQAAVAIDNAGLYQRLADALVTSRMSYRL